MPPDRPLKLETPPSAAPAGLAPEAVATATAGAAATLGPGWVVIQGSGGRRSGGSEPIASSSRSLLATDRSARVADGPRAVDPPVDQVEPALHPVQRGENFWTISKLYYGSGRYYRALHAANARQVPDIRELYVGTGLRVPPPDALDRTLIDPPSRGRTEDPAASPASRVGRPNDADELAVPVARPRVARRDPEADPNLDPEAESDPETRPSPRRPTYTVKPHETLRSIARDTLNDPRRDREIYNLNRDILDDPNSAPAGTLLTLPEDAVVGRRAR
jgi:nucleoid-associated protein YgaU